MAKTRKPTALHLVENTLNTTRHADRQDEPQPKGRPIKPPGLLPAESKIWNQYFAIAYWLTEADSEIFALYCQITGSEVRRHQKVIDGKRQWTGGVQSMDAARIAQWRMLAQELGLTPASRSKINVGAALVNKSGEQKQNPKDPNRFFERSR